MKRQRVRIHRNGPVLLRIRLERDHAQLKRCAGSAPPECGSPANDAPSHRSSDAAGETHPAPAADTDRCTHSPPVAAAPLQRLQLLHRARSLTPQRQQPQRILLQQLPAAVSEPSRAARSSSTSPTDSSSLRITWLIAGCVRCSRTAAREKLAPPPPPETSPTDSVPSNSFPS
jgi:hypothetical protein